MYNWLIMDGKWRNISTWCLPFLGSQLHRQNSCASSGALSCKEEDKVCSGRCSYGSNGIPCTSYCVCEGGMLAVTLILNARRTKATHKRVKWILMNLRGREWLIEPMTVDTSRGVWHSVVTIRCLLNYCHRLILCANCDVLLNRFVS